MEDSKSNKINLVIKWSGKEFKISDYDTNLSVGSLKQTIQNLTGVLPERQKLLNVKFRGKAADDNVTLSNLNLKDGFKIMMMGSLEEVIAQVNTPAEPNDVINDLDIPEEELATVDNAIYLNKIERRIATYKVNIINPPRDNRKLIVLDIDYTIFDHRSTAEQAAELMRPFLHEFLITLYPYYDIMFWSATSMKWITEKLKLLGVSNHSDYKIVCYFDSAAMISVDSSKHEVVDVKPLQVIWGLFPQYNATNTVMLDDIRHNFIMNKQSGLRIRPFRQAHFNRDKDRELLYLAKYLKYIAKKNIDFTTLNHKRWESFIAKADDVDEILAQNEMKDLSQESCSDNQNENL